MGKYTPGPWYIRPCAGGYLIEGSEGASQRVVRGSGGVKLASDAELITASPDLLRACEFALSVIEAQGMFDMSERMAAERLEAAIAKAHGQADVMVVDLNDEHGQENGNA